MRELLETLCAGLDLSRAQTAETFAKVFAGALGEIELAAVLTALKAKGESPDEIAGAAEAMRQAAAPFVTGDLQVADSCGTGGDGTGTVNISTAVALIAAQAGLPIVKHGNRSVSSKCGSADVLEQCGVKIDASPETATRCLSEVGICFLFAPQYHSGVRFAMPVRRALGVRTLFNILGPLANPAQPEVQLLGVYDPALCVPMAETLGLLGCRSALVVHGGGLDEIALHSETTAARLRDGVVESLEITPEQVGFSRGALEDLRGGDAVENARWLKQLAAGEGSVFHNQAVAINAGALLWIGGRAADLRTGCELALETLTVGGAARRLERWAEISHS